jgi:hypothetical protein
MSFLAAQFEQPFAIEGLLRIMALFSLRDAEED